MCTRRFSRSSWKRLQFLLLTGVALVWIVAPAQPKAAAEAEAQRPVVLHNRLVLPAPLPDEWAILLTRLPERTSEEAPSPPRERQRIAVNGAGPLKLQLPCASRWDISAELPGFWVRRQELDVGTGDNPTELTLDLWPLGTVSGRLRMAPEAGRGGKPPELPKAVRLKTVPLPSFRQARRTPPGVVSCPVAESGTFRCTIPAGEYDLVITAEGTTPAYQWGIEVPAAVEAKLGDVTLRPGASVAAWVEVEGGRIDPEKCLARLTPVACEADAATLVRNERTAVEAPVSRDGFVQITGLSPGIYALEISQPGFAPARVAALEVQPGRETFIPEPLLLTPPATFGLQIHPPLDPWGKPWRGTLLYPRDGSPRSRTYAFQGVADESGGFKVAEQTTGTFLVRIADSRGNFVFEEERDLTDGAVEAIEIERLWVEGRLSLGEEPLAGSVRFGGHPDGGRVTLEVDTEGQFSGFLPREGHWLVDIDAAEPPLKTRLLTEVEATEEGTARVELNLPDNRVFGRVVDARGVPVPGSRVTADTAGAQGVSADGQGRFEFRSLSPGWIYLGAEKKGVGMSEAVGVTVAEEGEVGPVELRLRPLQRVRGTVVSAGGPVAEARVMIHPRPPAVGSADAVSGPDGTFVLDLPAGVTEAVAVAGGAGHAWHSTPVTLGQAPLTLTVSEEAGELAIDLPFSRDEVMSQGLRAALFQYGVEVTAPLLLGSHTRTTVATAERTVLVASNLAPGDYTLCLLPRVGLDPASAEPTGADAACASGWLRAGGTLTLRPAPTD